MADEVNYQVNWKDKKTQCVNCKFYQSKDDKNACVPEGKNFEEALELYGEASPSGHCNFFMEK